VPRLTVDTGFLAAPKSCAITFLRNGRAPRTVIRLVYPDRIAYSLQTGFLRIPLFAMVYPVPFIWKMSGWEQIDKPPSMLMLYATDSAIYIGQ
jgi:hypothetical protein